MRHWRTGVPQHYYYQCSTQSRGIATNDSVWMSASQSSQKCGPPVGAGEGRRFGLCVVIVEDGLAAADARMRASPRLPASQRRSGRSHSLPLRPVQATRRHVSTILGSKPIILEDVAATSATAAGNAPGYEKALYGAIASLTTSCRDLGTCKIQ